jgi:hypothetical protein
MQEEDRLSVGTEFAPPDGGRFRKATQADVDEQRLRLRAQAEREQAEVVRRPSQASSVQEAEAALGRAKVAEAKERQRIEREAEAAKVRADGARNEVRRYAGQVTEAAKAAAAALKLGPPAPMHIRSGARALLHGGGRLPWWGSGNTDATLDGLFTLHQRGMWLNDHLEGLDAAGRVELDLAENAAWKAVIERARVVAGEA